MTIRNTRLKRELGAKPGPAGPRGEPPSTRTSCCRSPPKRLAGRRGRPGRGLARTTKELWSAFHPCTNHPGGDRMWYKVVEGQCRSEPGPPNWRTNPVTSPTRPSKFLTAITVTLVLLAAQVAAAQDEEVHTTADDVAWTIVDVVTGELTWVAAPSRALPGPFIDPKAMPNLAAWLEASPLTAVTVESSPRWDQTPPATPRVLYDRLEMTDSCVGGPGCVPPNGPMPRDPRPRDPPRPWGDWSSMGRPIIVNGPIVNGPVCVTDCGNTPPPPKKDPPPRDSSDDSYGRLEMPRDRRWDIGPNPGSWMPQFSTSYSTPRLKTW